MNIKYFNKEKNLDNIMDIWLKSNIEAHNFVDKNYWINNFDLVKSMIKESEIYIYEENNKILGFIGLSENYIAGIFIDKEFRNKGIGKNLLDYAKDKKDKLYLNVYEKNNKAMNFYIKNQFIISEKNFDDENNEYEYKLIWNKN
ncbi:GNAT family N-acetyltransferase [Peptoniphilus stercorisuis]|uniref:Ribosomal protein S18 acetylase RimI-like enzyme n=1 Tax=Peptoniphilus stercorisuis TaxID=1436965 RepID=A0ABS4KBX1_9FIRM|nr:GNAT family N-acetyltransferase [Peptoniphilus stercorisuis]MBP2024756.1 ribosomal protein S18 acetylase RimI-like enzyme [Peptoniphilus stercorisuis]